MNYKFLSDEKELKWFFDKIISKPEKNESYLMCISARSKKLDPETREKIKLGRGEMMREEIISPRGKERIWDFNQFKSHVIKYECPYEGMITKNGYPYPQNCLVIYIYFNPSDECNVAMDFYQYTSAIMADLLMAAKKGSKAGITEQLFKLQQVSKHQKSCHALNISRVEWRQFDFDLNKGLTDNQIKEAYALIHDSAIEMFGMGNVCIIRTAGGFHTLIKRDGLKYWNEHKRKGRQDPFKDYLELTKNDTYFEEAKYAKQCFVPLPGTYQYGDFSVYVVNKEEL